MLNKCFTLRSVQRTIPTLNAANLFNKGISSSGRVQRLTQSIFSLVGSAVKLSIPTYAILHFYKSRAETEAFIRIKEGMEIWPDSSTPSKDAQVHSVYNILSALKILDDLAIQPKLQSIRANLGNMYASYVPTVQVVDWNLVDSPLDAVRVSWSTNKPMKWVSDKKTTPMMSGNLGNYILRQKPSQLTKAQENAFAALEKWAEGKSFSKPANQGSTDLPTELESTAEELSKTEILPMSLKEHTQRLDSYKPKG